jgi:hypothetical protein
MPAIRLIAGLAVAVAVNSAAPSWSADAPVPPPPSTAASEPPTQPAPVPVAPDTAAKDQPAPTLPKEEPPQTAAKPDPAAKPDVPTPAAGTVVKPPSVTVIEAVDAHGILGRDVRSPANENMGRIADVIVDRAGQVRAVVVDFGGFLNVADKTASITLELTRDQVRAAPEYKDDAPIVVLGASGALSPLRSQPLTMQER